MAINYGKRLFNIVTVHLYTFVCKKKSNMLISYLVVIKKNVNESGFCYLCVRAWSDWNVHDEQMCLCHYQCSSIQFCHCFLAMHSYYMTTLCLKWWNQLFKFPLKLQLFSNTYIIGKSHHSAAILVLRQLFWANKISPCIYRIIS